MVFMIEESLFNTEYIEPSDVVMRGYFKGYKRIGNFVIDNATRFWLRNTKESSWLGSQYLGTLMAKGIIL